MRYWSKFGWVMALLLTLQACGPLRQISPPPSNPQQAITPSLAVTTTPTPTPVSTISSLSMIDAENGWGWTDSNRLLRTEDSGQTWIDRTPDGQVWPEDFFALDAQTAWVPVFFKDSNLFGLLSTMDGGQSWQQLPYSLQNPNGQPAILHFSNAQNGWAETGDIGAGNIYYSLYGTRDGGKTWATIPIKSPTPEAGLPAGTVHLCSICEDSFYYDPARTIIISGDMASGETQRSVRMQVSFDLGDTWQTRRLELPKDSQDAFVANSAVTFFSPANGRLAVHLMKTDSSGNTIFQRLAFYNTQDGGSSWSLVPGELDEIAWNVQPRYVSLNDLFILCGSHLCASHDGGGTWQTLASNLEFTQTGNRSVSAIDFVDGKTGWVVVQENQTSSLYTTSDGGLIWNQLAPKMAPSVPVMTIINTNFPTPSSPPTPTVEASQTPQIVFDPQANANRIHFAPKGTWVEINATASANTPVRYVLEAMEGQVMSAAIKQGPAFSVQVSDSDNKRLDNPLQSLPFWRGVLSATQDYFVSIESQSGGPFSLRIAINPPGQATQDFEFSDPGSVVSLRYSDEFAPTDVQIPVNNKGTPLLTIALIDPGFYAPRTNLSEAYVLLAETADPTIVSTCTQPSSQVAESVTGKVTINHFTFTRSEFSGAAAGNLYDQVAYRSGLDGKCFEVFFLIHSTNTGNYPPGTVVEYDHAALSSKFEAVLNTFLAK